MTDEDVKVVPGKGCAEKVKDLTARVEELEDLVARHHADILCLAVAVLGLAVVVYRNLNG